MLPFRATSGSIGCAGSVAVDEKTSVSASRNCAAASSCVPKVSCVFLLGVEIEAEQLLVAADARHVDDELAVGRPGRRVVGEVVVGEVGDLAASRDRRVKMSPMPSCAAPRSATVRAVGREVRRLGLVDRLHRDALLDLAGEHVLDDQRALLLGAHEVGEAIALRRPRHPRHRVPAARRACTMYSKPHVLVEAARQVADDRAVLRRDQHDVELAVLAVAGDDGDAGRPTATARSRAPA